ncbi:hypothetical protein ILUMI_19782 [Ignelater luminosus]|uniref:Uncharacterized protein n=1 Tax=Ignelater luminosus TaxID=2038154 RepID=A0A8K0CJT2_IGNLU|nr:hypothetical protein ILUMI_19782 [Ignelater luminosus]
MSLSRPVKGPTKPPGKDPPILSGSSSASFSSSISPLTYLKAPNPPKPPKPALPKTRPVPKKRTTSTNSEPPDQPYHPIQTQHRPSDFPPIPFTPNPPPYSSPRPSPRHIHTNPPTSPLFIYTTDSFSIQLDLPPSDHQPHPAPTLSYATIAATTTSNTLSASGSRSSPRVQSPIHHHQQSPFSHPSSSLSSRSIPIPPPSGPPPLPLQEVHPPCPLTTPTTPATSASIPPLPSPAPRSGPLSPAKSDASHQPQPLPPPIQTSPTPPLTVTTLPHPAPPLPLPNPLQLA